MSADGVKIAEEDSRKIFVGDGDVFKDFFDHVFGLAVGVRKVNAGGHGFDVFIFALVAIDGSRAREDYFFSAASLHGFKEVNSRHEVCFVIL